MLNFRYLTSGFVGLFVVLIGACTGVRDSGTPTFLIPVLDQNGKEHFAYVQLSTLPSPYKMDGGAARIYFNPSANGLQITGSVAEPHLARDGSTFIPKDPNSGSLVATYAYYEKMMFYEKRVLLESQISWPRTIAVYHDVKDLPKLDEGNASYVGAPYDETAILPFTDDGKVALSLNAGVLGHEHLHAHFDAFVTTQLKEVQTASVQDVVDGKGCPKSAMSFELKLLRSWNEGLADFYGAVTSQMPQFMLRSVAPQMVRIVNADPKQMRSTQQVLTCNTADDLDPYYNGEQLSRALYSVAAANEFPALGADGAQLSKWDRAARYIIHRLSQFSEAVQAQKDWTKVHPEFAICFFLQDVKISDATKTIVNKAFSKDFISGVDTCDQQSL